MSEYVRRQTYRGWALKSDHGGFIYWSLFDENLPTVPAIFSTKQAALRFARKRLWTGKAVAVNASLEEIYE